MKMFRILLLLCLLMFLCSNNVRSEESCYKQEAADCPGHDIALYYTSARRCRKTCNLDRRCQSYQFHRTEGCRLKNYACSRDELSEVGNKEYSLNTRQPCLNQYPVIAIGNVCYLHQDAECPRRDLGVVRNITMHQCLEACPKIAHCVAVQYKGIECWFKNSVCTDRGLIMVGNHTRNQFTVVPCPSPKTSPPGDICYTHEVAHCPGGDIATLYKVSISACLQACSNLPGCKSAQYVRGDCWLKHHVCSPLDLADRGTYAYNQFTKTKCAERYPDTTNECFNHQQGECVGRTLATVRNITLNQCFKTCSNIVYCISVQHDSKGKCELKNYICRKNQLAYVDNFDKNFYTRIWCRPSVRQDSNDICYSHRHADCSGRDIIRLYRITLNECFKNCTDRAECKSAQYHKGDCWLKHSVCTVNELNRVGFTNYHFLTKQQCTGT